MERREFLRGAVAAGAGGLAAALLPCRAGAEGKDGHVLAAGPAALSLPADRLVIAEPTVKGHVGRLMRKLDAPSRLRVVARAGRLGLL